MLSYAYDNKKEKLNNVEKFPIINAQWTEKVEAKKIMQILFTIIKTQ
jgi:hypothetical protein